MLAIGLAIVALGALLFVGSVNRQIDSVHRRLDQHQHMIATLAALLPVRALPREERPPAPQQEELR